MIDLYQFDNANNDGDKEAVQVPNVPTLVNKLSANETNGIKDKLNELVQNVNILENSDLPKDQLLSKAEITITVNDVDIVGATRYVINEASYEILTPETFTINYTAAGLFRKDIVVVDTNGDYLLIAGVEGAVAIKPDVPLNTLEFAEFDVTDSSITEFVDVNDFWITKADKKEVNFVKNGNFTIYKNYTNTNNPYNLEPLDVAIGWLPNTQIFIPIGQYLGGNVVDINNWNTSPMDFTI